MVGCRVHMPFIIHWHYLFNQKNYITRYLMCYVGHFLHTSTSAYAIFVKGVFIALVANLITKPGTALTKPN